METTQQNQTKPANAPHPHVGGLRRRRLLLASVAIQALLLGAGLTLAVNQSRATTARSVERFVLDQNVRTAEVVASSIRELGSQEIVAGSPEWERLQSMVEQVHLSSDGFVCILDAQGRVLCHPDLRRSPEMLGMPMADTVLHTGAGASVRLGAAPQEGVVAGTIDAGENQTHYVATSAVPNINGRLTVHQPAHGLARAGNQATTGIWAPFAIAGVFVIVLTGGIMMALVRRHDRALETINQGLEAEVQRRIAQATHTRDAMIRGLAKLADYRDTDTGTHLDRIAEYSTLLAGALRDTHPEIDPAWIATLRTASSLHDIGKVGIPDAILLKPGKFTPEERKAMERHPMIGTDTLLAIRERMGEDELVEMSLRVALYHHERWDGAGYPVGLRGEEIPLEARIVALADVYDALTSQRVYKDAVPHEEVVEMIRQGAGTQFDPGVAGAFATIADEFDHVRQRLQPAAKNKALPRVA